jgi:hypothetical protein
MPVNFVAAPRFGKDDFTCAPGSAAADGYRQLAGEVVSRIKKGWAA